MNWRGAGMTLMIVCGLAAVDGQTAKASDAPPTDQGIPERYLKDTTRYVRSHHGPATVIHDWDMPQYVVNALYPDGTRGPAMLTREHGWRRKSSGPRRWIYGRKETDESDVRFIDGDQPVYQPPKPSDQPNLEADLANDPEFIAALRDDRFAMAVCKAFDGGFFGTLLPTGLKRSWYQRSSRADQWRMVKVSDLKSIIAGLRDLGESREDYFECRKYPGVLPSRRIEVAARLRDDIESTKESRTKVRKGDRRSEKGFDDLISQYERDLKHIGHNADVFARLETILTRLGWRPEFEADRIRVIKSRLAQDVVLLREIRRLEARPPQSPAPWARRIKDVNDAVRRIGRGSIDLVIRYNRNDLNKLSNEEREATLANFSGKLLGLVTSGRISKREYRALRPRVDQVANRAMHNYRLPKDPDNW